MIQRQLESKLDAAVGSFPVVGLVGARQTGKTTVAKMLAARLGAKSVYLDLERPSDLAKLGSPELYLEQHADKLVILDEIQRMPELFPLLRALVDDHRRNGRFLLLGSASPDLMRQSSESLAGRITYLELSPLHIGELPSGDPLRLWSRGGFPPSYLAQSDADSATWRESFVRTYLERDIPMLGIRVPSLTLGRFWQMLAHSHGQMWNGSKIAAGMGVSGTTTRHYLDILENTFIVRQLQPFFPNLKKRVMKSPKVYLRDSGLLHSLLGLRDMEDVLGHPTAGPSWEGWVIEQIIALAPRHWRPYYYRTASGAEIDLVLENPGQRTLMAFEIRLSTAPAPARGFWSALSDLDNAPGFIVCPVKERYPLAENAEVLPVRELDAFFRAFNSDT